MKLKELMADVFGIEKDAIIDTLAFQKIDEWDSLSHMNLILRIEDVYRINLLGDEIAEMQNVALIKKILIQKGVRLNELE